MATTREQAQAYAYENRRQITSFIRGTDEALRDPRRRLNRSMAGGIALGVLVMAVFGVIGFLGGGRGPALPEQGAVVVSGTGDRYVVTDGIVHPALNLTSALLVGGGDLTEVKASTLEGTPRGLPVGIPNAPDALPDVEQLSNAPWTVCVVPSGSLVVPPQVRAYVALQTPGGTLDELDGILLRSPDQRIWLAAQGRRHVLPGPAQAQLLLQRAAPVDLSAELIATIPEGQPIVAPELADRGAAPQVDIPGTAALTGDVLVSGQPGSNQQFFLVRRDGLTPVSQLVATLLGSTGSRSLEVDPRDVGDVAPSGEGPVDNRGWPERVPDTTELQRDQPLCVSTVPGENPLDTPWRVRLHTPEAMPEHVGVVPVRAQGGQLPGLVDAVSVPSGSGAVVRASTASGGDGAYTLVTDAGQRYPIANAETVLRLRYDPSTAPNVPESFVALLPSGPVLDPTDAQVEYSGEG